MLKLNKLEVGVFPSSQMQGMPVIHFDLFDDGTEYEKDEQGKPTQDGLVKCAEGILNQIKEHLETDHFEEDWVDFLLAKKYGVFTGDDMASEANLPESDILFRMISHISHDMQNDIEEVEFRKRPPMFVFSGTPKYYTGLNQFYENFNVVFCNVKPNELPENMFAFLEMQKHTFCNIQAVASSAEDVQAFYDNYLANEQTQADPNRTVVLVEDPTVGDAVVEKASELKMRVMASLKSVSNKVLDL